MEQSSGNFFKEKSTQVVNAIVKDRFFQKFISNYWWEILLYAIVFSVVFYFFQYRYNIVNRQLRKMLPLQDYQTDLTSLVNSQDIMNEDADFRLSDFWIASSYKTYLVNKYSGKVDIDMINMTLRLGCRFIDLDIFSSGGQTPIPVVANGIVENGVIVSDRLLFEDVIKSLSTSAFSSRLKNGKDPLFINLNMDGIIKDDDMVKTVAKILTEYLGKTFVGEDYIRQGRDTNKNFALIPIKQLLKRNTTVLLSSSNVQGTPIDNIINACSATMANLRYRNINQVNGITDVEEMMRFNKQTLTVVTPNYNGPSDSRENYNWMSSMLMGCQFSCINYNIGKDDELLSEYIDRFSGYSMLVKPLKLRYSPVLIPAPLAQNKEVSFAPKSVITPDGSINV